LKAQRSSLTLIVLLLFALGLPNAVAATKPKAAGRSATAVINTVLNGKGTPSKSIGINGDFYIDTRSLLIFGPKTKGKWPAARSLQGANGANGVNGSNGSDGKNGNDAKSVSTASNAAGPAGPQGVQGVPGVKGLDGTAGSRGADGANGINGSPGPAGATGATGSGATGAAGANGSNGAPGITGATGARGETGTAGVTEVRVGTLIFSNISGSVGSSSTSNLDGLKAGKSYLIRLLIYTHHPDDRSFDLAMPLDLSIVATSGSPAITKQYVATSAYSYRNGTEGFEWSIDAQVIIDGSLVSSDYGISVSILAGKSTTATPIAIDCFFSALLVGQVK
jgi:hypothetical protein